MISSWARKLRIYCLANSYKFRKYFLTRHEVFSFAILCAIISYNGLITEIAAEPITVLETQYPSPKLNNGIFNKSKVVQRCLYSYRQRYSPSQWLATVFHAKESVVSESDQNHDTKKEQALSITFSQYDWFIS